MRSLSTGIKEFHMQTISVNSANNDNGAASTAVIMAAGGTGSTFQVFRPKTAAAKAAEAKPVVITSKSVKAALEAADALLADYTKLKVEVLDRSDRALWEMLEKTYGFSSQIESSTTKRETRNELIKQIQLRDKQGMASNSSTEAVVVRYVFADQSRQSRNNYTVAMEKARSLGIAVDKFADFLTEHGGVGKVVEKIFDYEEDEQAVAQELADSIKAEKTARTKLVGRLYSAMAHSVDSPISYSGLVSNWVPEKPESKAKTDGTEKVDPKYETGNFVFFVTVKNPETGKFHVVQGNVFDQAYEQQLLASIAERMDVTTDELSTTVQGLERSIGFGHMAAQEQEAVAV
jgi:hypothetical protein